MSDDARKMESAESLVTLGGTGLAHIHIIGDFFSGKNTHVLLFSLWEHL